MKLFKCQACGQAVYFENRFCGVCNHELGYLPLEGRMAALEPSPDGIAGNFVALGPKQPPLRFCANVTHDACNWLIPAELDGDFCLACRHNGTIPDILDDEKLHRWRKMEGAKHRLFYTLIALKLPLRNRNDDAAHGLTFDFLAEEPGEKILTGHDEGEIVINLDEADDAHRERLRNAMHEPYRTLLGHFRHEVGHYFWDVLVRDAGRLEAFRDNFGDDRADYAEALKRHYAMGPPADWQASYISSYATSHPWEDFAETWAHYLHIVDTLETASAFGLRIHPASTKNRALHADIDFDPHRAKSAQVLINAWLPLTFAVNSLNRSMGHNDMYPFIVSNPVVTKLQFIHELVHAGQIKPRLTRARGARADAAPEQPPAPAPSEPNQPLPMPGGPTPPEGPDVPPLQPPVIDPPIDPPQSDPPVELPPDDMPEIPPPNEMPGPLPLNT